MRDARITIEKEGGREGRRDGEQHSGMEKERERWGAGQRNGERKYSDGEQVRGLEREK